MLTINALHTKAKKDRMQATRASFDNETPVSIAAQPPSRIERRRNGSTIRLCCPVLLCLSHAHGSPKQPNTPSRRRSLSHTRATRNLTFQPTAGSYGALHVSLRTADIETSLAAIETSRDTVSIAAQSFSRLANANALMTRRRARRVIKHRFV